MIKQMKLNIDVIGKILSTGGITFNSSQVIDDSASEPTKGINPLLIDITTNKNDITTKQNKLIAGDNITIVGDTISASGGGSGENINSSKVIDDSDSEPTKGINPIINDVKERKELIQIAPEGTKVVAVSSDGTKQYSLEIDAKNDVADFDGLKVEGISSLNTSSFNASTTVGELQSDISILEDGSGVLIAREGNLEYYLTLNGANGFEINKIENGSIVEYIPTDQQIVVGKNLSDLKIDVNGKVEGINGVITLDKDTIYEDGGVIKAKVGLAPESAELLFANKVNYDTETGSKAILNATNGNEMEFKVGELAQPSLLLEENGINMLNGRIIKTNTSDTNDSTLINKAEVKELIANAAIGDWINIYDNGNLVPADDGNNNYYYVFTPNSSNLDKFSQAGEKDYVAVPGVGLCFSEELNIPFYDFSVVGDFSDLYGAESGGIWLEDTLTLTVKDAEKFQNKEFIVYVKDKEPITNIIYNKIVLKIDFNYLMTFKNGYAELQLNEQLNWIKTTYRNSTDKAPTVEQGTWLTSDRDFRINRTDTLDVGSVELSDYLLKTEAEAKYLTKTDAEAKYEPKEVWENIPYQFNFSDNKINILGDVSLFSKISVVGEVDFDTIPLYLYINKYINVVDQIGSRSYKFIVGAYDAAWKGEGYFNKGSNYISFKTYSYKTLSYGSAKVISSTIKIKGVRKPVSKSTKPPKKLWRRFRK